ncbi:unnamed protein product [Darwinula stevensoni]|uniref:26S proteasome non-ATPase regulatory subunit 5 n=1 Tax=Darwinula stevensoni TaxID=69355 RepID=A0A7R9FQC5_9CRUS|nr:unnamed protein product [Darwinula stevensoni]CAG0899170.1 unnamed protein product [Darwinula stevensoni]
MESLGRSSDANIPSHSAALEGLPKQFVEGLRTLFDIMDDKKSGFISFHEIEQRWKEEDPHGLPKGVLDSLRKVTPSSGLLSFERFCAGLKICLLRNRADSSNGATRRLKTASVQPIRPPSAPILDLDANGHSKKPGMIATVRPTMDTALNTSAQNMRSAMSMPQLHSESGTSGELEDVEDSISSQTKETDGHMNTKRPDVSWQKQFPVPLLGPPKPPRMGLSEQHQQNKGEIRAVLYNWHQNLLHSDSESAKSGSDFELSAIGDPQRRIGKNMDFHSARQQSASLPFLFPPSTTVQASVTAAYSLSTLLTTASTHNQRKSSARRREPRRHTLTSGIDYTMLKRLKQVEQERDMLVQGLQVVDRAREWYQKQISAVEDKMRDIGQIGWLPEYSSEAYQERLNFQYARISEVNQHLEALIESSERGFPLHMNLAFRLPPQGVKMGTKMATSKDANNNRTVLRLRDQNRQLTEEVGKKSERITMLEKEKAALLREVFQVGKWIGENPSLLRTKETLLRKCLFLIGDEHLSVGKAAMDMALKLASSLPGMQILQSEPAVLTMKEVMEKNDSVRYRVYEVVVKASSISQEALDGFVERNFLPRLIDEVQKQDILVQLNAIEMLTELALTPHGLHYLEDRNVLKDLEKILNTSDGDPLRSFLVPGAVKFFGNVARLKPEKILDHYPQFIANINSFVRSDDLGLKHVAVDTFGFVGSTLKGKLALQRIDMKQLLQDLSHLAEEASTETRTRAMNTIASLLSLNVENSNNELENLTESWFRHLSKDPMQFCLSLCKQPFTDIRTAALKILQVIASQHWGQVYIKNTPGCLEYILDRCTEHEKAGKEGKYEVVSSIVSSPTALTVFGTEMLLPLRKYEREGPFFVAPDVNIAFEGDGS